MIEDLLECMRMNRFIAKDNDEDRVHSFVLRGDPLSYSHNNPVKKKPLIDMFRNTILIPYREPVAITAIFYRPNYQRIDVDNMMKVVMDAATKAKVWIDDCYVVAQAGRVELDIHNPRTVICVGGANSSLDRTKMFECTICHSLFKRAGKRAFTNPPQTCSRKCRDVLYAKDRSLVRCAKCEVEFVRNIAGQRYCSKKCSSSENIKRAKAAQQRPWPKCSQCGGRVSRREYIRCANCSAKGRKIGSKNKTWKGVPYATEVHGVG